MFSGRCAAAVTLLALVAAVSAQCRIDGVAVSFATRFGPTSASSDVVVTASDSVVVDASFTARR